MAGNFLTPDQITRRSLLILHQKLTFVGSINRAYDDSFAQEGAKIGETLRIRLPNQYVVRTGATLSAQSTNENSVQLAVQSQRGVDMQFTSRELTMTIDDFADRILEPAMAVLAASIEADAMSMYRDVYNIVDDDGAIISFADMLRGRRILNDNLAPMDDKRTALLSTDHNAKLVDALKGLFQDSSAIKQQYREGMMGRTAGFDFYESTHVSDHASGTAAKTTTYLTNGATQNSNTAGANSTPNAQAIALVVDTGTTTFNRGDVVTIAGVFAVHPETKVSTGRLQQFVVTANAGPSATTLNLSPGIVTTGAQQNVSGAAADNSAIVKVAAGASELINSSLVYHKDAFTFASADLVLPRGVDMASRQVYDGISMRLVRQYDINADNFPVRFDVLYGYRTIRPQLACRIHADA